MPILNWLGKDKVINHHQQVPYRVLEPQYAYGQADSAGSPSGGNMIIHGDNLDALKALLPRFEGKVKCIYIDPPYNTGNESWVYNDNVNDPKIKKWLGEVVGREGEDLSRHDKWLCMMYPRLRLLQRLLAEDGAIFISIDDNEQANLKLICDEILGTGNFVSQIVWNKRVSPARDAKFLSTDHEFVLVYAKNRSVLSTNNLPRSDKNNSYYKNPDNDPRGSWNSAAYTCNKSRTERPNLYYPIVNPNTGEEIYPKESAVWAYSQETHQQHIKDGLLYWGVDGKSKQPRKKAYLSEVGDVIPRSVWNHSDVGSTQRATLENNEIFGDRAFAYPKPPSLIERILQIATNPGDIILDSFAGSGTTAHAVLNMNKVDGGNRRFILVEMEDYADSITAERVKRVIDGYGEGKNATEGTGGGFTFYELGERLLLEDGNLNESLNTDKICEYVWYTETRTDYTQQGEDYLLGVRANTAYYFYYEKEHVTVLDHSFLHAIKTKAGSYLIYADINALSAEEMDAANIRFKKIPRDITRL